MEDAVNTGFVARNVLIDQHTFQGDPKNDRENYELIREECRDMVQQIKQSPIPLLMDHGKNEPGPPVRIGQVHDAKFNEQTGDMAVQFRVPRKTIADAGYWQMLKTVAKLGGEPWELSLKHTRGNPPIAREVSMCLKGARYGTTVVASSDPEMKTAKYNNRDVCASAAAPQQQQQAMDTGSKAMDTSGGGGKVDPEFAKLDAIAATLPNQEAKDKFWQYNIEKKQKEKEMEKRQKDMEAKYASEFAAKQKEMEAKYQTVVRQQNDKANSLLLHLLTSYGRATRENQEGVARDTAQGKIDLSAPYWQDVAASLEDRMKGPVHQPSPVLVAERDYRLQMMQMQAEGGGDIKQDVAASSSSHVDWRARMADELNARLAMDTPGLGADPNMLAYFPPSIVSKYHQEVEASKNGRKRQRTDAFENE